LAAFTHLSHLLK